MIFVVLLAAAALLLAGTSGFFSIYGFGKMFAGAFWPVVIMAGSLEFGKLMSASFLYRYWHDARKTLTIPLTILVIVTISITSIGIFGFLSAAYQTSSIGVTQNAVQIEQMQYQLKYDVQRKNNIDQQISKIPPTWITAKQRMIKSFGAELTRLNTAIPKLQDNILNLKNQSITKRANLGPIEFAAAAIHKTPESVVKYLIILIMFIFDPLAVLLVIATNAAILDRRKIKKVSKVKDVVESLPKKAMNLSDLMGVSKLSSGENQLVKPKPLISTTGDKPPITSTVAPRKVMTIAAAAPKKALIQPEKNSQTIVTAGKGRRVLEKLQQYKQRLEKKEDITERERSDLNLIRNLLDK